MKKRLMTLLLALTLLLSLAVPVSAVDLNYKDKDEITYKEAVAVLSREGIINGFEDGTFRPKETLTRAQASTILTKILGGSPDGAADFSDVRPNAWYAGYVAYCAYNEIVAGLGDGTFNPEGKLTGTAWSKMLLTGLGYDAVESGMQGSGWATNVANLADVRVEALPNQFYFFNPRLRHPTADDGEMTVAVARTTRYAPNAYGLFNMIGNVEEWCEGPNGEAVARGGAFDTLPRRAKFKRRIPYFPWQRVYNTGVRLVMEEK